MRIFCLTLLVAAPAFAEPLPIDPLWESEAFRKTVTGSFGIDSRIEPNITLDEEHYLNEAGKAMADNDRDFAIETLTESSLLEESPAMIFMLATLQFENEHAEEAIANFQKAIEIFPNFRDAHRNLAIALIQQGETEEAAPHLIRAMELGSREGITLGLLGYCHAVAGHHQAALDAYRLAMISQPKERQWLMGQAQALQALEKPRESAAIFQQLIEETPHEIHPWLLQADAWVELDQPLRAIGNLELARRTGDLAPEALLSLGNLYLRSELPFLALARYREAVYAAVPLGRAVEAISYLTDLQNWQGARELVEAVEISAAYADQLNSDATDKEIRSELVRSKALIELATGNPEKGATLVEGWLEKEPLDGNALILLARFKEESGKREEAEMLLEQAARVPAHAAEAHLAHGKLLVTETEYAAAVEHIEAAYKLDPKPQVAEYLAAVKDLARE